MTLVLPKAHRSLEVLQILFVTNTVHSEMIVVIVPPRSLTSFSSDLFSYPVNITAGFDLLILDGKVGFSEKSKNVIKVEVKSLLQK